MNLYDMTVVPGKYCIGLTLKPVILKYIGRFGKNKIRRGKVRVKLIETQDTVSSHINKKVKAYLISDQSGIITLIAWRHQGSQTHVG